MASVVLPIFRKVFTACAIGKYTYFEMKIEDLDNAQHGRSKTRIAACKLPAHEDIQ